VFTLYSLLMELERPRSGFEGKAIASSSAGPPVLPEHLQVLERSILVLVIASCFTEDLYVGKLEIPNRYTIGLQFNF